MRLLDAAATTHGEDIETSRPGTMAPVMVPAARWPAAEGLSGDLTPLSIAAAVSTVPEKGLPGASGLRFRRTGEADPAMPAVRVRSGLVTTLDDEGQPPGCEAGGFPPTED